MTFHVFETDLELTDKQVYARCAFLIADSERLKVEIAQRKKALAEQSNSARVPYDNRSLSFQEQMARKTFKR